MNAKKAISGAIAHVESLVVRVTMCFIATSNCDSTISRCDGERGIASSLLHEGASSDQRRGQHRSWRFRVQVVSTSRPSVFGHCGISYPCRQSPRKAFSCCQQSVFCQFVIKSRKRPMPDSVHPFRPGWPANDERQSGLG